MQYITPGSPGEQRQGLLAIGRVEEIGEEKNKLLRHINQFEALPR